VAVVKLSHFLQVSPGAGFLATAGLMVLITLIANRNVHRLWELTRQEPSAGAGA
jgi:paraquat-inducible protein A